MRQLRRIVASRYAHLCMGLLVLYGLSWSITYTSRFEKILNNLRWYCTADYAVRSSESPTSNLKEEFARDKFKERLSSLTAGLFDYSDKYALQAYFLSGGFVYDVWQEDEGASHLLAEVIGRGHHDAEMPERVSFEYFILSDKKVAPFREYQLGPWARVFVSAGEVGIYIHRDAIDFILHEYFESLWMSEPQSSEDFYWGPLTYSLYRDLHPLCEEAFVRQLYGSNKKLARKYFVEQGLEVFLPTMLAMATRMAADQRSPFSPAYRYQRAYLAGLSLEPNYTMMTLLELYSWERYSQHNPWARELSNKFHKKLGMTYPDKVTLDHISWAAGEILEELDDS